MEQIWNWIIGLFTEIWVLLAEMAPYLLLGFVIAGLLKVVIPQRQIFKHLAKNDVWSVIKASLFGVPLPLCSCGVLPVAAHLRNEGAGKGPTMSFLVSTPTSGVDSILATYSLMGPLFAIMRPISSFISGLFSGISINAFDKEKSGKQPTVEFACAICEVTTPHTHRITERAKAMFRYAGFTLVDDTWKWLIIGIAIGGVITFLIPDTWIEGYLSNPFIAYPLMLLIGIPMYVCATGSIPIAAVLIMKGMEPGAALVFLIAGPATNTATLSFIFAKLGKKSLFIYLAVIIITSIVFGIILDYIWYLLGEEGKYISAHSEVIPEWVKISSSVLLLLLIARSVINKFIPAKIKINQEEDLMTVKVNDMTCDHCKMTIEKKLKDVQGVDEVAVDLNKKEVHVSGEPNDADVRQAITDAGYTVS